METMVLGRTNLIISRDAFGALPIQRLDTSAAVSLLRRALDDGITFYDTARGYTDSEEKLGIAFGGLRERIVIASKSGAGTPELFREHLDTSLRVLRTDYVDIFQFHNPKEVPGEDSPMYRAMLEAKRAGKVRHIGISCHKIDNANIALESGLYDTIQYPLSCLSSETEIELIHRCKARNVGVIAMKALCGGLLTSAAPSMAFLRQFDNVVPIWGIQRDSELTEIVELAKTSPCMNSDMTARVEKERSELMGEFCRGCGYCLPCPAEIPIPMAARISYLLKRSPGKNFVTPEFQKSMSNIENCIECGACKARCPYELDTPTLLKRQLVEYHALLPR